LIWLAGEHQDVGRIISTASACGSNFAAGSRRAAAFSAVAAIVLSRPKLTTRASVGFAVAVLAGWVVEAAVKWAVGWVLSHFQWVALRSARHRA
jgi:hypothetical protein